MFEQQRQWAAHKIADWAFRSLDFLRASRWWHDDDDANRVGGIHVREQNACSYTAFFAAVNRISSDVAKLPLHVYRQEAETFGKADAHAVYWLLHTQPNDYNTPYVFRQTMMNYVLRWGNAYAEIQLRGDGRPQALHLLPSEWVTPQLSPDHQSFHYLVKPESGRETSLAPNQVLHLRGLGDPLMGWSPVKLFREALELGLELQHTGRSFFKNMFRPSAVLEYPGRLGPEAYARLKADWRNQNQGSGKTGDVPLLEEGMKLSPWSIPPEDAQFLESRVFATEEIARIFNMPPHKLANLSKASYANVEEQNGEYVVDCLQPWLTNFEQECDRKLFLPGEQGTYYCRFSIEGMLRGNSEARSNFYSRLLQIGVLSINEIRALENLAALPKWADRHFVQVNLADASAPLTPPPAKPAIPPEEPPAEPPPEKTPAKRSQKPRKTQTEVTRHA